MTVTLRRDDGREQSFRIVGEDEADPSRGTLSHLSPLARALLTHGPGEAVSIAGHEAVILDVGESVQPCQKSPALWLGGSAGMGIER